ncbi:MAG: DinB family protein [Ginsengibacter sp.]
MGNVKIRKPVSPKGTYPPAMARYIDKAGDEDLVTSLQKQAVEAKQLFQTITEQKSLYKYAEGKWTLKELLQHIIDAERVFAYRALAFARKDKNTLPSFDENEYADNSNANSRVWEDLINEFTVVRQSTEYLFDTFSQDALLQIGKASNYTIEVSSLGFVIAGHLNHHLTIIKERYLNTKDTKLYTEPSSTM